MDEIDREMLEALDNERRSLLKRLRIVDQLITSHRGPVIPADRPATSNADLAATLGVHRATVMRWRRVADWAWGSPPWSADQVRAIAAGVAQRGKR